MAAQHRPAVTLSAGLKPAAVTQKAPAIDAPVINDIVPPTGSTPMEAPQSVALDVDQAPAIAEQAWPITITVRNDSRASIVCPVCGLYSSPATTKYVTLHDADHARASVQNIRDLAALQNVSADVVITGLPDGL